jgi:hypothetical protein
MVLVVLTTVFVPLTMVFITSAAVFVVPGSTNAAFRTGAMLRLSRYAVADQVIVN